MIYRVLFILTIGAVLAFPSALEAQVWSNRSPDSTELVQVPQGNVPDTLDHYYRRGGSGYWSSAECLTDGNTNARVCQELQSTAYSDFSGLYTKPRPSSKVEQQLASSLSSEQYVAADSASPRQAAMWRLMHSADLEDDLTWFDGKPHAQTSVRLGREIAEKLQSAGAWDGFPSPDEIDDSMWEALYSARWTNLRGEEVTSVEMVAENERAQFYQWNHALAVYDRRRDLHAWFVNLADVDGSSFKVDRWRRIRDVSLSSGRLHVDVSQFPPSRDNELTIAVSALLKKDDAPVDSSSWRLLAGGLEIARFSADRRTPAGDSTLVVIRAAPETWPPRFLIGTQDGPERALTARKWAREFDMAVVANAGMYGQDYTTHVGYLRTADGHVNNPTVNQYKSAAAFAPKREGLPPFRVFDLDETPIDTVKARYKAVAQNLRLIKRPRENRWPPKEKRWSEMALAEDEAGRMLFVFSRSPYTMHEFNEILLELPIGLVAAQHLEGGPEASLFVNLADDSTEAQAWMGSWETGFNEADDNKKFWPIPNAIGLTR